MYIVTEECLNRSAESRSEGALMLLEMFNRSDSDEHSGASNFVYDLYNLGHAFFQIRTMMAKGPDSVPQDWLLRREVSQARRNVLARYPRLLNERFVNAGFNALEALFDLVGDAEFRNVRGARTEALAISHFFQNTLHNIYVGSRFGLLDLDRALGKQPSPPVSPTHEVDQQLLH